MEYYLITEIKMWFMTCPKMSLVSSCNLANGQVTKKKAQVNVKATWTLQCGLSQEQLSKVALFSSARELWDKLIELHVIQE